MTIALMSLETQETVRNSVGQRMSVGTWRPFALPRTVVVICHDPSAHNEIPAWPATRLVDAGCAVYALNLRGCGWRVCEPFFVGSIRDDLEDLSAIIESVRTQEPDRPIFLLGRDAVGVVVRTVALSRQAELVGLVGESFVYKIPAQDATVDNSLELCPDHVQGRMADVGGAEAMTDSKASLGARLSTG